MTTDNRLGPDIGGRPRARLSMGGGGVSLRGVPAATAAAPGEAAVVLGYMPSGRPVTIATGSLELLVDLESAIRAARAWIVMARSGCPDGTVPAISCPPGTGLSW
jgi:hypothetical protein